MPGTSRDATATEAVAVFEDDKSFQAAIDELLSSGFDISNICVLAHEETIKKLGRPYASVREFEDDPNAPRICFVPGESIGDAEGAIIGASVYVPAMIGAVAVAASGGTLLVAIGAVCLAGGAGGLAGAALARHLGHEHTEHLGQHLERGGLLLWVRTPDVDTEKKALDILSKHSGRDVHLHELPSPDADADPDHPRLLHMLKRVPAAT